MKIKPFVLKLLSCNCNLLQIKQRVGYENPSKETLGYAPGSSKEIEEEKGNIRRRDSFFWQNWFTSSLSPFPL